MSRNTCDDNIKSLKSLRDKIISLDHCEHIEILKILETNNVKYTQNKNGFFINLNKLNDKTIESINDFLNFISNNNIKDNKIEIDLK